RGNGVQPRANLAHNLRQILRLDPEAEIRIESGPGLAPNADSQTANQHVGNGEILQHGSHFHQGSFQLGHTPVLSRSRAARRTWMPRFSGSGSSARTSGGSQSRMAPISARMSAGSLS